jgi:hypothetical protein
MTPKQRKFGWVIVVSAFLLVGYMMLDDLTDRLNTAEANSGANRALATDAAEKADALAQQVRGLGEVPVVTPPSAPAAAASPSTRFVPVPGTPGNPGPVGAPGSPGAPGTPGTPGEAGEKGGVGAGGSTGSTGQPGEPGADGKDGSDGKDGAQGPAGADGENGTNGADGRGIRTVACQDDGTWLITYTDDTTETADGPCRVLLVGGE